MIAVVQRIDSASVTVADARVAGVGAGLLVLVGAVRGDGDADRDYIARRLVSLRVFADAAGRMNRSLLDTGGEVLLVSQFTLAADTRKGRRPSFVGALAPELAAPLLSALAARLQELGAPVQTGQFGAHMKVELVNDGPVTLLLDSRESRRGHWREAEAGSDG